jgi:hypothetical protein
VDVDVDDFSFCFFEKDKGEEEADVAPVTFEFKDDDVESFEFVEL